MQLDDSIFRATGLLYARAFRLQLGSNHEIDVKSQTKMKRNMKSGMVMTFSGEKASLYKGSRLMELETTQSSLKAV